MISLKTTIILFLNNHESLWAHTYTIRTFKTRTQSQSNTSELRKKNLTCKTLSIILFNHLKKVNTLLFNVFKNEKLELKKKKLKNLESKRPNLKIPFATST